MNNIWRRIFSRDGQPSVAKKPAAELPKTVYQIQKAGNDSTLSQNEQNLNINFIGSSPPNINIKSSLTDPVTTLPVVTIPASITNAENAAVLYIIPNGEKEWLIRGISPHKSIDKSIKSPCLPVDLWDYGKNILESILKWLRETIDYFRGQCNLAIVDTTSEQIPWEIIELIPGETLGGKTRVVRWVDQEAWGEMVMLNLAQRKTYRGQLVDYEHPVSLGCDNLHDRLQGWRTKLINHHRQPVAIGLLDCQEPLTNQVNFKEIARSLYGRPLFLFVNSPYSARLVWQDQSPSGLAAKALSEIASGYFGTIAKVEGRTAREFKQKFLEYAHRDCGISPAQFLQAIREYYQKFLFNDDDPQRKRKAEQIFSYVYYGNPDDVVKITGGGQ